MGNSGTNQAGCLQEANCIMITAHMLLYSITPIFSAEAVSFDANRHLNLPAWAVIPLTHADKADTPMNSAAEAAVIEGQTCKSRRERIINHYRKQTEVTRTKPQAFVNKLQQ